MDETAAIDLCLHHRDPAGFEYLVEKYRREAYVHAVSLLGNQEDAADLCQEAFTRAFIAIRKLPQLDHFYPWFYRILRNCCLNFLGRQKTADRYAGETEPIESLPPSLLLEQREDQLIVWRALRALVPQFREILIMKYIHNHSYDVISQNLHIPRGTVMSRLYHARKTFRDAYLQEVER